MTFRARLTTWTVAGALLVSLASSASDAGVIDDFNTPGLGEYNLYKILDQNAGTSDISFSDAAGNLSATSVGTSGAEQVMLLRSDFSLNVGQELQVDGPITDSGTGTEDLGLAVGQTPTSLGNPAAGSTRNLADYAFISFRNPTQLNTRGFVNNAEIGQVQSFGVTADKLFIARLANNDMQLGYYTGDTRTVVRTITPTNLGIYDNVGFYSDLRADAATLAGLDNLQIIPEPASLLLLGISACGLIVSRRR